MSEYTHVPSDLKTLVGQEAYAGFIHQEQEQELLEASACDDEPLVCYFCNQHITQDQPINLHHPHYKSDGGSEVVPAHEQCHVEYHSRKGDYRTWGKRSAETRA